MYASNYCQKQHKGLSSHWPHSVLLFLLFMHYSREGLNPGRGFSLFLIFSNYTVIDIAITFTINHTIIMNHNSL